MFLKIIFHKLYFILYTYICYAALNTIYLQNFFLYYKECMEPFKYNFDLQSLNFFELDFY